ncbi:hypothetical protein O0L34_g3941 [Tuta absoluta]|nr:hypothetical protein O0L34_g3941 [Tuta absoluta]
MPPKMKSQSSQAIVKKSQAAAPVRLPRPPISQSSLMFVPEDAVKGHRERLDCCVDWTLSGTAIRYHQLQCSREDIPVVSFTEALNNKIKHSILNGFLDENSTLTFQQHWDVTLPLAIWDSENGSEEKKILFKSDNNITEDLIALIKLAVKKNDREILRQELINTAVLRVTNTAMTNLDTGLLEFKKLVTLSLCGNYIDQIDCVMLPQGLACLELQANRISNLDSFVNLPPHLYYLGLSRNILTEENLQGITQFPRSLCVLDLSENEIYHLERLLDLLMRLPNLTSLLLAGNPCSVCAAYATTVTSRLQRLHWLDNRQVLKSDRKIPVGDKIFEPHPDDLKSAYFFFSIFRIMSVPLPPRPDKGSNGLFHVELELPLLDSKRRNYLMFGEVDTLTEMLLPPEDDYLSHSSGDGSKQSSKEAVYDINMEVMSEETDIYAKLEAKDSRIIQHYTTYQSNKVPWSKTMTFADPTVRIFCPDLRALRDTFRSNITVRLVYTLTTTHQKTPPKGKGKSGARLNKSVSVPKPITTAETSVTIATVKCSLKNPNWSQPSQHFHWDDSLRTNCAIHWGDGDLTVVNYAPRNAQQNVSKGKQREDTESHTKDRSNFPENMTIHVGFGIETLRNPLAPKPPAIIASDDHKRSKRQK